MPSLAPATPRRKGKLDILEARQRLRIAGLLYFFRHLGVGRGSS